MAKTPTTKSDREAQIITADEVGTLESVMSMASETEPRTEKMSLADAIASLDHTDDSLWTSDNKPRMEVLEALTGGNLTRADVDAAGAPTRSSTVPDADPEARAADAEARIAELEADIAFLRKQFGWPKRST
jgi:uncharacterized protein YceH (UPF0502 family)